VLIRAVRVIWDYKGKLAKIKRSGKKLGLGDIVGFSVHAEGLGGG
jgi:hypothetical protein